jgi:aspartate aminotransferase
MERAKAHNIIVVPSDNFGVKGYVRLAYCVSSKTIINSMKAFEELYKDYQK